MKIYIFMILDSSVFIIIVQLYYLKLIFELLFTKIKKILFCHI